MVPPLSEERKLLGWMVLVLRSNASLLLLSLSLLPLSSRAETAVSLDAIRVRALANLNGRIVARLPKGSALEIGEGAGEWAQITAGEHKGYFVARQFMGLKAPGLPRVADGLEANRELAEALTSGYFAEGKLAKAEHFLKAHLQKDSRHAKGFALLARAQDELGNLASAREAYRSAAAISEGKEQALYLHALADCYAREGDVASAEESLSRVERVLASVSTASADQVLRMRNLLRAGAPLPSLDFSAGNETRLTDRKFTGTAAIKAGYDSNVLLQADDANAASSSGSALVSPSAKIGYATPLMEGQLSLSSFTSFTAYAKQAVRSSNNLYESFTAEWAPGTNEGRFLDPVFGNRVDLSLVNSAGLEFYSVANTIYFGASKKLDEKNTLIFELPVGYQRFAKELSAASAADNRSGFVLTPSLMLSHRTGQFTLNGGLSYSEVLSLGDNYRTRGFTVLAGASRALFWELNGRLSWAYTRNSYHESSLQRRDNRYDFAFSLSRVLPFNPNWSASLEYVLTRNASSLASARYTRGAPILQVNYGF